MTAAVTVTVTPPLLPVRYTAEIRDSGRGQHSGQSASFTLLRYAGVPRLFDHAPPSGRGAAWTFPATRIGDVVAAAEARGVRVVLEPAQEALL